ncbi:MAG: flavodoxin, partial [Synergistaceae bacterium]|nr:flavodoxin [Synergistaceae bacterium]
SIMRTLVAFFSKSGRTRKAAEQIAATVGADLHEIRTEKGYPKGYLMAVLAARRELSRGKRPTLSSQAPDLDGYDRVLLGFPIWWGTCPMAVLSFLEGASLDGKDVWPFCTSTSGGIARAKADIERACPGTTVHEGLRAKGLDEAKIAAWLAKG